MKKALWEAAKEPLRILACAIIPVILLYVQVIDAQWAVILTGILRVIDKVAHDVGKVTDNELLKRGLTQF